MSSPKEPTTLSNPEEAYSEHIHFDLNVDFDNTIISGSVEFSVVVNKGAKNFVLDTKSLTISAVTVDGNSSAFKLEQSHPVFGVALSIVLPAALTSSGGKCKVVVAYRTSPSSSACQWLPPSQTAGKRRPYLFTQCQAIHARSLFPCQDCPKSKCTWSAKVVAPAWATVLMSALQEGQPESVSGGRRVFQWRQPVPTCTYLVALAVGDLASQDISPRCKVWSEPSMLKAVAHEFAETEEFLAVAEGLACPYAWGRYDVLCLPPSFPFGGMENPCLTFVTPTLLAGDRSLAGVVAHEISHSWTGNLITNVTWEHFWLNEGWTVWLERRIQARRHPAGMQYMDFLAEGGWKDLQESVAHYDELKQPQFTALVPKLDDVDPDDSFSSVPYEKGFNLLYTLEKRVGTPRFEAFVKEYVEEFKFRHLSSEQFRDFAVARLGADKLAGFDWEAWFRAPGLPPKPAYDATLAGQSAALADAWIQFAKAGASGAVPAAVQAAGAGWGAWSSQQRQAFLDRLLDDKAFPVAAVEAMEALYKFSATSNAEIRHRWLTLALRAGAAWAVPQALTMATTQGRMKFTRPLFRDVSRCPVPGARDKAVQAFLANVSFYHPICRSMVAKDLGLSKDQLAAAATAAAARGGGGGGGGLSVGAWAAVVVVGYLAYAVWRVKNNRCPIPFF